MFDFCTVQSSIFCNYSLTPRSLLFCVCGPSAIETYVCLQSLPDRRPLPHVQDYIDLISFFDDLMLYIKFIIK